MQRISEGLTVQREDSVEGHDGDCENMLLLHDTKNGHLHGRRLQSGKLKFPLTLFGSKIVTALVNNV